MERCKNFLFFPYRNNKYIPIILRLYSDSFCTIGANDKCVYWLSVMMFSVLIILDNV